MQGELKKSPVETTTPQTEEVEEKSNTSTLTLVGALLILVSFFLPIILNSLNHSVGTLAGRFGLIGIVVGAMCLLVVLASTENKADRIISKTFFVLALLLIATPITLLLIMSVAGGNFIALLWLIVDIVVMASMILLFLKMDSKKSSLIKTLAWLAGIGVYLLIGFLGMLFINPPSIFYGTPMYRPKLK